MSFVRCKSSLTGEICLIPYHRISKILDEDRPGCATCVQTVDGVMLFCADENGSTKDVKLKDSVVTYGGCGCCQGGCEK